MNAFACLLMCLFPSLHTVAFNLASQLESMTREMERERSMCVCVGSERKGEERREDEQSCSEEESGAILLCSRSSPLLSLSHSRTQDKFIQKSREALKGERKRERKPFVQTDWRRSARMKERRHMWRQQQGMAEENGMRQRERERHQATAAGVCGSQSVTRSLIRVSVPEKRDREESSWKKEGRKWRRCLK